jgi:hypothetical protein
MRMRFALVLLVSALTVLIRAEDISYDLVLTEAGDDVKNAVEAAVQVPRTWREGPRKVTRTNKVVDTDVAKFSSLNSTAASTSLKLGSILIWDAQAVAESLVVGSGMNVSQVTATVSAEFTVTGFVVMAAGTNLTAVRDQIALDLNVSPGSVTVTEAPASGGGGKRRLLADVNWVANSTTLTVAIIVGDDFEATASIKTKLAEPETYFVNTQAALGNASSGDGW